MEGIEEGIEKAVEEGVERSLVAESGGDVGDGKSKRKWYVR